MKPVNSVIILKIFLVFLFFIAIGAAVIYRDRLDSQVIESWLIDMGIWAPIVFVVLYALITVLFLPGSLFTLIGGALFGPVLGAIYNLSGATLGATLAFLIARHLASDWAHERSGNLVKRLISGVEEEGWRFIAFVRLVPLFPFNLLNYALGLTRIPLIHYIVTSAICMAPAGAAYTYVGYVGREAIDGSSENIIQKALLALAVVAIVLFLPRVVRRLRKKEKKETKSL